ncbi:MAG: prepilin-type N-terminal cleavage/methylation domain-containing protein [Lachnospiraceae bacterium]|nr:prepilin-type N-terminal cleavage/methylation domain-containing protein [Lachnospiraceae bacterium]
MSKLKKLKNDSRGFSLVEIIIVIAIMAAISGVAGFGFSMVSGKPAEECARKLASAISHGRTVTLGKYRNTIKIEKDSSGQLEVSEHTVISLNDDLSENETSDRSSVVGAKGVTVEYRTGSSGSYTYTELTDGSYIEIWYDSASGAMKEKIKVNGTESNVYCTGFRISKAGKAYYVILEPLTGGITFSTSESQS